MCGQLLAHFVVVDYLDPEYKSSEGTAMKVGHTGKRASKRAGGQAGRRAGEQAEVRKNRTEGIKGGEQAFGVTAEGCRFGPGSSRVE